ncbi:hypothetical protein [Muricauda sp. MAR_2010_75]|jgi:hypothetical protein|uniref:hypothetical protein n=1 Tax=Allomuricauda sp. MAR_2010_75 TaxID=1250232 RepID=UPI0005618EEB|nr:hypothetical protein [Muricauda sp. MAR_2010_75]
MKFFKLVFGTLFTYFVAFKKTFGQAPAEFSSTKEATSIHDFPFYITIIIQRLGILPIEWRNKTLLQFFFKPLVCGPQKRVLEPLTLINE